MPTLTIPPTIIRDRYLDYTAPIWPVAAYDGTEVHGCLNAFAYRDPSEGTCWETCDDADAEIFSVYLHHPDHGLDCVGDFTLKADAEAYAAELDGAHGWK